MSKPLAERFEFYYTSEAGKWQALRPGDIATRALILAEYQKYLETGYRPVDGELIETTEKEFRLVEEAKAFIEKYTGLAVDCNVTKVTKLLEKDCNGAYDRLLHTVFVIENKTGTDYGDEIELGSLLVHELMHSTSVNTSKIIGIFYENKHKITPLQSHHEVDITPSLWCEHFFEEGLAEEISSRWREQFDPALRQRDRELLSLVKLPEVPVRMYNTNSTIDHNTSDKQRRLNYSSLCAFGIQLLSEYTGVDIIDLLIQARKPETQIEANRRLKETVDSVEPGLYDVLTSAEYTSNDFNDCIVIIKQAIANHAHTQNIV